MGHYADCSAGIYLAFQRLRFTRLSVTRTSREPLPHDFTLTWPKPGGIFSVALSVPQSFQIEDLPVRKQAALCCPDFPLPYEYGSDDPACCKYKGREL